MEKVRVFVANDDDGFLALMQDLLEDGDYSVTVLKAAKNAYEEIVEALPDLLILDIVLEHPDAGWRVLDMVKLNPDTASMPIIVCSADARALQDKEKRLKEMGCFVIYKPFKIDELFITIEKALSN